MVVPGIEQGVQRLLPCNSAVVGLHPSKQTWLSAADGEMRAETLYAYSKMKELMALAAGLLTIFQDREDVRPEGLRPTGSTNATPRWRRDRSSWRESLTTHSSRLDDLCPTGDVLLHKIGERLLTAARLVWNFVDEVEQPLARNIVI